MSILDREVAQTGEPVPTTVLADALTAQTGCRRPLAMAEVASMVRRGVLERVDGRPEYTRVAPTGSGFVPTQRADDDAMHVLDALRRTVAEAERPVSTRAVAAQLKADGVVLAAQGPNVVRKRLETLARPRVRGSAATQGPLVARAIAPTRDQIDAAYWLPIEAAEGLRSVGAGPSG
ncbi:MAG: hypothetical protein HEQ38_16630 [Gemmatimonas sp.]|nr:hypothetical protein [Gemmatimonas sp.]